MVITPIDQKPLAKLAATASFGGGDCPLKHCAANKAPGSKQPTHTPLFEQQDDDSEDELDALEREARENEEAASIREMEASQRMCQLCHEQLIKPVRFARCRCALCACCVELSTRYIQICPCCCTSLQTEAGSPKSDAEELRRRVSLLEGTPQALLQHTYFKQLQARRKASTRAILEFGNTSTPCTSQHGQEECTLRAMTICLPIYQTHRFC